MCGIFGFYHLTNPSEWTMEAYTNLLVSGLKKLEYRGYDSAGLATSISLSSNIEIEIIKSVGNVEALQKTLTDRMRLNPSFLHHIPSFNITIGHTRWATHGQISVANAHPHSSDSNHSFVIVHNGIITNYGGLKTFLCEESLQEAEMVSQTDTEIIARLFHHFNLQDPSRTFIQLSTLVCSYLKGAYAFLIISKHYPKEIICCRKGSPLLVGVNMNDTKTANMEYYMSSDASAFTQHTQHILTLEDDDIMHITEKGYDIYNIRTSKSIHRSPSEMHYEYEETYNKGTYKTFMEKEIKEQPVILMQSYMYHLEKKEELRVFRQVIRQKFHDGHRVLLIACGTSYHSCLIGRNLLESTLKKPVVAEISSDFIDRDYYITSSDVCLFISQSGETADTLCAMRKCLSQGAYCIGITNHRKSTISRESHTSIDLRAGYEVSVASTKA